MDVVLQSKWENKEVDVSQLNSFDKYKLTWNVIIIIIILFISWNFFSVFSQFKLIQITPNRQQRKGCI